MKLLIIGGTGVISSAIALQALEKGWEVTAVNRGSRIPTFASRIRTIKADRQNKEDFAKALAAEKPDVVIDMICFDEADAKQTVSLFRNRSEHLIFTSSVAAYARPYVSTPTCEDRESLSQDKTFAYGYGKARMEEYLNEEMKKPGAAVTIIRPSLTFGPGARNFGLLRQNYNVISRIRQGKPLVMFGEGMFPWTFTYVDDLAQGFVLAAGNPKVYNDTYQVLNTETVVWEDLYRTVGKILGVDPRLVYVPSILLRELDEKLMGHLWYEKCYCSLFSIEKFQKAVPEYKPRFTFREGITKVIESWEREGLGIDPVKDKLEDDIIGCYERFRNDLMTLRSDRQYAHSFK